MSIKKMYMKDRKTNRVDQGRIPNKKIRLGKIKNRENCRKKANTSKTLKIKKMRAKMSRKTHHLRHHKMK